MSNRFPRFGLVLLIGWLALLVFWMVRPTLALPYYSDDFDHGQLIAQIRAGLRPSRDLIIVPFHGQTLVLLRLLFWLGTFAGGMGLTWVRVGVSAVHIAGAAGCAILCARWTGSRLAGFLAGTLYAGALGFINEQIWWPSSAIFCLGAAFFILAMVAIEYDSIGWAVLMLVIASLGLNGVLIPALVLPVYCWLSGRRRAAGVFLCVILALLAIVFWQQSQQHDQAQIELSLGGFGLGAWLILTAPLRFFSGFTTFALPGFQTICKLSPLAWLPLLASVWFMKAHYRRVLLAVWIPSILLAFLVGFARANFYPDRYGPGVLYVADRYYYFFLLPLVVHCVLFLSNFRWPRWRTLAVCVALAAALIASRARYLANVPRNNFEAAARALAEGRLVNQTIRSYAAAQPLTLTDAPIPIDGSHLNSLTLSFLVYSEYPRGIPGVGFVRGPLDARETAIENSLLKPWARAASSGIDFKEGSYQEDLTSGFSWWEPPFRWIGGHASLHLISAPGDLVISAYAPVVQLHRAVHVSVMVNDHPAGAFIITTDGVHDYHLQPPALTPGTQADITLTSDVVWHARDIFPQSLDERNLSIALSAIGFAPPVASP
jgi:hypothetical protein